MEARSSGTRLMIPLFTSCAIATVLSLIGTRALAGWLRERGRSQPILRRNADNAVVPDHVHKEGTPTLGGVAICLAVLVGFVASVLIRGKGISTQSLLALVAIGVLALIGLSDDLMKLRARQNRGMFWKAKGIITLGISIGVAGLLAAFTDIDTRLSFTRADLPGWELGPIIWTIWAGVIIFCTANAVNVTDGLDGLAAGSALAGFGVFAIIAYVGFRRTDLYPHMVEPLELAMLAAAFVGGCAGFLWWNAAPAQIFMGDVGALGIGTALGVLALCTNTQLLLPLICAVNVAEIGSVAIQMSVFRATGRRRRLFRLSPIHHHFEMGGWPETRVIIRFWLLAGAAAAMAIGIFIADFTDLASR